MVGKLPGRLYGQLVGDGAGVPQAILHTQRRVGVPELTETKQRDDKSVTYFMCDGGDSPWNA